MPIPFWKSSDRPDPEEPERLIKSAMEALLATNDKAHPAWMAFEHAMLHNYAEFSEALSRHIPEDRMIHFLSAMLVPILRNGFKTGASARALFDIAESMGAHLMPVHFYSPVPETRALPEAVFQQTFESPGWAPDESRQQATLNALAPFVTELEGVPRDRPSTGGFCWNNPALTETDAACYYAFIRRYRPRTVLEVGSGYSTMIAAQASLRNGATELHAIEPYPSADLKNGIPGLTRLITSPVQDVPLDTFTALDENDILFIDSTHIVKIGSDVNYLFLHVLPSLRPGVLIHIHDIFLPFECARSWVKDKHIFWNEQYLLLAFLLFNERFETLLMNQWLGLERPHLLAEAFPLLAQPGFGPLGGGSYWMRRVN